MTLVVKIDEIRRCFLNVEFANSLVPNRIYAYIKRDSALELLFQWVGHKQGQYDVLVIEVMGNGNGNPIYGNIPHSQSLSRKQECWFYL